MVWPQFLISAAASLCVGMSLVLGSRSRQFAIGVKEAFVLTTLSWIVIAAFASLPILLSMPEIGISGAFFEAMSGLILGYRVGSHLFLHANATAYHQKFAYWDGEKDSNSGLLTTSGMFGIAVKAWKDTTLGFDVRYPFSQRVLAEGDVFKRGPTLQFRISHAILR